MYSFSIWREPREKMSILKVGLVQRKSVKDPGENLNSCMNAIREATRQGAGLVVLHELHNSLYFPQSEDSANFDLAETIPGESTRALGEMAAELGIVIVASIFEKRAEGLYHNTAVVLEKDGKIAGRYRKTHIPDDPQYQEKFYFTPGDLGIAPIDTSVGRLGILVCWDQWFPEAARLMALQGVQILIYPTAIGWIPEEPADDRARQLEAWMTVQRGHAIANGIPLVAVNRTGFEPLPEGRPGSGIVFWGSSFAAGSQGEILAQASTDKPETLVVEIDFSRCIEVRRAWPFLRDRRVDLYGDLDQLFLR